MKKPFVTMIVLLLFSLVPLSGSANTISAQTKNSKDSKDSSQKSPYDMVSSNGNVISLEEYTKMFDSKTKFTSKPIQGTGQVLPERKLIKDPNKPTIDLGTGKIIEDQPPGTISPKIVLGADDRQKVNDTSITPYRQITYIELEFETYYGICTGTVVGPDTILTNAHCVRNIDLNLKALGGYVIPALIDNHYSYGAYEIERYYYPDGYDTTNGSAQYDYAVLKVKPYYNYEIGSVVGSLAYTEISNLSGTNIKIYGYPADKASSTGLYNQWGMSGNVSNENTSLAFYTIDTYKGQSGSAMLNSSNQIVGVHNASYDTNGDANGDINGGPKMNSQMAGFIRWASLFQ